jgi:hypothetical protein
MAGGIGKIRSDWRQRAETRLMSCTSGALSSRRRYLVAVSTASMFALGGLLLMFLADNLLEQGFYLIILGGNVLLVAEFVRRKRRNTRANGGPVIPG